MVLNKKYYYTLSSILLLFVLSACNSNNCETSNTFLQQAQINSTPYNLELARMVNTSDSNSITYYFSEYRKVEGVDYIIVEVHGQEGCALGRFTVTEAGGLSNVLAAEGKGYSGAEFKGFMFTIDGNSEAMDLVFKSVATVVD